MNFLHNNKLQKVSATFLLAVLMFINAVKTFHTHDFSKYAKAEKSSSNSTSVKSFFSCSICDFQFAKDGDTQVASVTIQSPLKFVERSYNYILSPLHVHSFEFSVRGPPAII